MGYGHSEGLRNYIHSNESMVENLIHYIDEIDSKYGGPLIKKFIIGYSLGGLLTLKLNSLKPDFFSSMALIGPYLKL